MLEITTSEALVSAALAISTSAIAVVYVKWLDRRRCDSTDTTNRR